MAFAMLIYIRGSLSILTPITITLEKREYEDLSQNRIQSLGFGNEICENTITEFPYGIHLIQEGGSNLHLVEICTVIQLILTLM